MVGGSPNDIPMKYRELAAFMTIVESPFGKLKFERIRLLISQNPSASQYSTLDILKIFHNSGLFPSPKRIFNFEQSGLYILPIAKPVYKSRANLI